MRYRILVIYPEGAGTTDFVVGPKWRWQFGHRAITDSFVNLIADKDLHVNDGSAAGTRNG
jgi:hypothetical protein